MESVRYFLSGLREHPLAKELRAELPIAKEYDPTSYYPIDVKEVSREVVAALNDAGRRKVDIAFGYFVDAGEQEKIHAAMREHGLVKKEFARKYAKFPSAEQILDREPEPFQYHFTYPECFWFLTINPVPTVEEYDSTKRYRIDAIQMPREVVAEIEKSGARISEAVRALKGDAADWGVVLPTLLEERERIHAAMQKYGLVKKEYQTWHPNIPSLEQIISQNKEEPFAYNIDAGRLWFIQINPVKNKQ